MAILGPGLCIYSVRSHPKRNPNHKLLDSLKADGDLLITYPPDKARAWYQTVSPDAFAGYAGAANPTYITLSRRALRDRFVSEVPAKNHGSLFSKIAAAQL